jgi:hypothetical protein
MNNLRKKYAPFVLFVLLTLLSGCVSAGTSPQARFYSLRSLKDSEIPKIETPALKGVIIGLGPLELPAYLDRPQIVTRGRDNELELAEFDRWAEPLEDAILRVIAQNLISIFPETKVLLYPWNYYLPVKYQVVMEIISIDAALQNEVRLCVNWSALNAEDKQVFLTKNSVYNTKVNKSNYNAMIEAINQGLYEFSLEIAKAIAAEATPSSEANRDAGKIIN